MSVLDFLFEGKPPQAVTTYGSTVEGIPKWMSDYTQGLVARANAIAAEPYQAYEGPRIAGFTPDQTGSFDLTRANIGSWKPSLDAARGLATAGGNVNPLSVASGYLSGAGRTWPSAVDEYMNPYVQNVLDRQRDLSLRDFREEFLPSLQDAFTGSGQFGSERMLEMGLRGTRDIMEGLEDQRLATLGNAYGQGAEIFGADASRLGQLGATAGNLATAGGELNLAGAQQLGALGEATSAMGLKDAAAQEAIGKAQQGLTQSSLDLAYKDFLEQRDYPRATTDWMSTVIRGLPTSRSVQNTQVGPADVYQPSPLAQLASAAGTVYGIQQMGKARGGLARARRMMTHG